MNGPNHPLIFLLRPAGKPRITTLAAAVIPLLAFSGLLVMLAAYAMPDGYSWRFHSISESAAQGQHGAWIARFSFLCFGAAVFLLSLAMRDRWPRLTYWSNLIFATSMLGAAAFSHSPWLPGQAADQFEDFLHSIFASGMGFAFCIGLVARLAHRGANSSFGRTLDALALVFATVLPLLLASGSNSGGLLQRVIFAVAYLWFARESLIALGVVREQNSN
jgi:Protein of unknown function (DUF998)